MLRSGRNYDRDKVSAQVALVCEGPGRTQQAGKEEADINTIVKRFGLTGQLPSNVGNPLFIDFDGVFDFRSAMQTVVDAKASFMQMPWETRERFGNDPAKFVDFCMNKENLDEMRKMGLAVPAPVVDNVPPVVPPVVP